MLSSKACTDLSKQVVGDKWFWAIIAHQTKCWICFLGIYIYIYVFACEYLGMGLANTLGFSRLLVLVTKFRFQLANQIWKLRRSGKQGWCEACKLQVVLEQESYCLDHIKWKGVLYYYQSIPKPKEAFRHQKAWYLVIYFMMMNIWLTYVCFEISYKDGLSYMMGWFDVAIHWWSMVMKRSCHFIVA